MKKLANILGLENFKAQFDHSLNSSYFSKLSGKFLITELIKTSL